MRTIIEQAPKKEPNYLARRLGALGFPALALFGVGRGAQAINGGDPKPKGDVTYTVKQGDSFFGIADRATDGDPRPLTEELAKQDDDLQPGDKIRIPRAEIDNPDAIGVSDQFHEPSQK